MILIKQLLRGQTCYGISSIKNNIISLKKAVHISNIIIIDLLQYYLNMRLILFTLWGYLFINFICDNNKSTVDNILR